MIKFIRPLLFALFLTLSFTANAQQLTSEEKEILKERVVQKVEEFQYLLGKIVDNQNSRKVRTNAVSLIYALFIGNCEPYKYYDYELERTISNTGAKMQTSSVNHKLIGIQKMKSYIRKLYNPDTGRSGMSYSKIEIDSVGAVRVDNIEPEGDHYVCVAYFCQKFIAYRDGKVVYGDNTTKKVKFIIKEMGNDKYGRRFDAKMGDIYVISTERIKQY